MKRFSGFPVKAQFTPVPNLFFSSLLPQITDIGELKTTLHVFRIIYSKRGYPRFTTYPELAGDVSLLNSLREGNKSVDEVLRAALSAAVERGTILQLVLTIDGVPQDVYFINTESDRRVVARIQNGEFSLAGLKAGVQVKPETGRELPDIFTMYEENIGMLTPMIAEELREAEKLYPEAWIQDAIKEAAKQGIRKWSYISAILERWSTEGRDDGTYQRDSKKGAEKYSKQKYGHMVER
jgi:DnaD/phage-associated family protein